MHGEYNSTSLRQLRDQQVRFAPRDKRVEQADRAERLLEELHPERNYSFEYLCFKITGYRPTAAPHEVLSGEDAARDLLRLIEDLTDAAPVCVAEAGEPVLTVEQLAQRFKVSVKTIHRWRREGLVARRFTFDGRKRVGFLTSSVERFVARHGERVKRGEQFTQLTDADREEIVSRARRLARSGAGPTDVARRLAKRLNRSPETIRYTLRAFDRRHPDLAVFPGWTGPLTDEMKQDLVRRHAEGEPIESLARRLGRTKSSVYRIVNELRARRILELPIDFIDHPSFRHKHAAETILAPPPAAEPETKRPRAPSGLPPYLASLYETPLLTREQEAHQFRKYNFLKFRVAELRAELDPARARGSRMDEIERLYEEAVQTKNELVQANLRLVVSIAKRHVGPADDFFQLVSDGNMSLIRAVEKFDFSRGNKFSTYASWAIMKNFARTIPDEFKHRDRFRTSAEETFTLTQDGRSDQFALESAQRLRREQVRKILADLDEREQGIIIRRFGLDHQEEPQTLKEVGAAIGVTKERVRQLEARALSKLRAAAEKEKIEEPD